MCLLCLSCAAAIPGLVPPAVWLPYGKVGQSPTGVVADLTGGGFGPFAGQMFLGEFTLSQVNRVFLEQIGGEYQGAAFRFLDGFQCGPLSLAFLRDGSLLVGETNRGWNSRGSRSYGLERVRWTGIVPFAIRTMRAQPDGFLLEFTQPIEPAAAANPARYAMTSYTYLYHSKYGSPEIDPQPVAIVRAEVAADALSVRLTCAGLREGYVHELALPGVWSQTGDSLEYPTAYYTLNRLPSPPHGPRARNGPGEVVRPSLAHPASPPGLARVTPGKLFPTRRLRCHTCDSGDDGIGE